METQHVLDQETAEAEFDRFIEENEIDADESLMDPEDRAQFAKQKRRLINALRDGSLTIDGEARPVYTPQNPKSKYREPLTFNQRSGASVMTGDSKKPHQLVAKTYAAMGDMTQREPKVFSGMVGRDIKICEAVFVFLMD